MISRFLKSIVYGLTVFVMVAPYVAITLGAAWFSTHLWLYEDWAVMLTDALAIIPRDMIRFPFSVKPEDLQPVMTVLVVIGFGSLAAFRADRSAAGLSDLVEEKNATLLFFARWYWIYGFACVAGPFFLIAVLGYLMGFAGDDAHYLAPIAGHDFVAAPITWYDFLTACGLVGFFGIYGINSVRRSVNEREPRMLFNGMTSCLIFVVPYMILARALCISLLLPIYHDVAALVGVSWEPTMMALQIAQFVMVWCFMSTMSALMLRARLVMILEDLEPEPLPA